MRLIIKYISFGHQSQPIERIKDLYDMYKMYVNNLLRKRGLKLYKKYFDFLSIPLKFFYS